MASLIYDSYMYDGLTGAIDMDTDTFYIMLVTSGYTPNKGTHTKRSNVTANEASGAGYSAGGKAIVPVVALDTVNHWLTLTFPVSTWPAATVSAAGCVVYKRRGGADTADELVAYGDFSGTVTSTADTFTATFSTTLKLTN